MKLFRLIRPICVVLAAVALTGCFGAGVVPEDDDETDGTGETTASNGTVTLSLSNAGPAGGETLYAYAYEAGEWIVDMPEYVVGAGSATIADGTAEFVLTDSIDANTWEPTGDDWTATGGANYDLYIYTYAPAEPGAPDPPPMSLVLDPWPKTVAVDGDTTVAVDYIDFDSYTPTSGTLTVSVSGAQEQAGKTLYVAVFQAPSDPEADSPVAQEFMVIPDDGTVTKTVQYLELDSMNPVDWYGDAEGDYDVYIFIDVDGSGSEAGPTDGDLIYDVAPITYWQYGDKVMPTRYEDYETVHIVTPPVD